LVLKAINVAGRADYVAQHAGEISPARIEFAHDHSRPHTRESKSFGRLSERVRRLGVRGPDGIGNGLGDDCLKLR
jgi:hypothetical protein